MTQLDDVTQQKLLQAILSKLDRGGSPDSKWPDYKGEYWALCPYHDDKHPENFSVSERGAKCFVCQEKGVSLQALAERLGIDWRVIAEPEPARPSATFSGCTLDEYAQAKHLDPHALKSYGLSNGRHYDPTDRQEKPAVLIPYRGEQGQLLGERHRVDLHKQDGKDNRFRWRKGDSAIGLLYGLWRLPEIRRAGWVVLVEGESDCHTLWQHGIPALGIPGVKTWRDTAAQDLDGLAVYVWNEKDRGGIELLRTLAKAPIADLQAISHPDYKDISEAHMMGADIPQLIEQAKADARPLEALPDDPGPLQEDIPTRADIPGPAPVWTPEHLTDQGNARRLVRLYGHNLRYAQAWGWLVWDGRRWVRDETGAVMRYAKRAVELLYSDAAEAHAKAEEAIKRAQEAAKGGQDQEEEKALDEFKELSKLANAIAMWAQKSQGAARLEAMVRLAQSELPVVALTDDFDADPWALNCENGTLDLRTGELRPHDRGDMLTKVCPVNYDPAATCPTWERFQSEIAGECAAIVAYKQRMYGYSLTGDVSEQAFFIAYGTGANGKSTEVNTIRAILGPDYAWHIPSESLLTKAHGGGIPNDLARLKGMRFVTAIESDLGRRLAEGLVKQLTGGDPITARYMRAEFFTFNPTHKLILATNHKPEIWGSDHAIWRRIKLIPYTVTIPKERQDKDLPGKLQAEAAGILAWLVRGCLAWQREGLAEPAEVTTATASYQAEQDVIGEFLADCCIFKPTATVSKGELYDAYLTWCERQKDTPLSKRKFGGKLTERGDVAEDKSTGGLRVWVGIGLLAEANSGASGASGKNSPNNEKLENRSLIGANGEIAPLAPLAPLADPNEEVLL